MVTIMTTLGPKRADELAMLLPHEHVFVDLRTWDQPGCAEGDPAAVIALMGPEIARARKAGVTAIVECSTVGVGRRADIDAAVSAATGFPLVVPTGIYREPWIPRWAHEASEGELYGWMLRELSDEIAGTGVRAGWIKLSAGDDGLTTCESKILRAAARAAKETDSVIGSHTIRGRVVRDQLDIVEAAGLAPNRFIWIHTQAEPDLDLHLEIAQRGSWIEYDAIGDDAFDDAFFIAQIKRAIEAGLGDRVLLCQDRGFYDPAQPGGGRPRPYTYLSDQFLHPPGGTCPFASCSTAFFDDRGYQTSTGATVGTVGSVLPGNNPPPLPDFSDTGFDTTSTTIRAYGDDSSNGFGNQKGLDLWTYFPSEDVSGQLYIVPQATSDLSIMKTHVGDFTVGVDGVYTLAVRNVGSASISGLITVTDTVPAGLNVVSAAGTGWACGVVVQVVTCTVTPAGGLASGASLPDISVTVNPTQAAAASVTNTATVTNANDVNPGNDSSSSLTGIDIVADLAVTKTDGTTTLAAGGSTTYTLTVTNSGPSPVTGAILTDPAVAGLAVTGVACAAPPGQCTGPTTPSIAQLEGGTFALPALAAGQTYRLSVTADVTAGSGSVANTATVAAPAGVTDPDPGNDSATDTDTVNPAAVVADLAVTKTDGTTTLAAGGSTTYTLTVTNSGPSPVTGAILTDPAVAGLAVTGVACAAPPGQCTGPTTPSIAQLEGGTFALPALAAGQTYRLSVTADVTAGSGSVANTATVAAPAGVTDPDPGNDSATDTDTVSSTQAPGLAIRKSASPTTYAAAGDQIAYRYVLTNTGDVALDGPFTVADDKTTVTCPSTASLGVGASITCTASYTISPSDVAAGSLTNVATASSADGTTSSAQSATVRARQSPTPRPTIPPTDTLATIDSAILGTSPTAVLGISFGLIAAIALLAAGRRRRRD